MPWKRPDKTLTNARPLSKLSFSFDRHTATKMSQVVLILLHCSFTLTSIRSQRCRALSIFNFIVLSPNSPLAQEMLQVVLILLHCPFIFTSITVQRCHAFLVADTQLFKRLCPSVGWSVGPSVGPWARVEKCEMSVLDGFWAAARRSL